MSDTIEMDVSNFDLGTPEGRARAMAVLRRKVERLGKEESDKVLAGVERLLATFGALRPTEKAMDQVAAELKETSDKLVEIKSRVLAFAQTQDEPREAYEYGQIASFMVVAGGALHCASEAIAESLKRVCEARVRDGKATAPTEPPPADPATNN